MSQWITLSNTMRVLNLFTVFLSLINYVFLWDIIFCTLKYYGIYEAFTLKWFSINQMKANPENFKLLQSAKKKKLKIKIKLLI